MEFLGSVGVIFSLAGDGKKCTIVHIITNAEVPIEVALSYIIILLGLPFPQLYGENCNLLYLLDSTRAEIGQFNGRYSTVRPAKSKTLFSRALFQDEEIK